MRVILTANEIANMLRNLGHKIGKVSDPDHFEQVDGEVEILGTNYIVQVGESYFVLTENHYDSNDELESVTHFNTLDTIGDIHDFLREKMNENN